MVISDDSRRISLGPHVHQTGKRGYRVRRRGWILRKDFEFLLYPTLSGAKSLLNPPESSSIRRIAKSYVVQRI